MAIGFTLLDGSTQAIPDRGLQHTTKNRVLKITFGDGYEQRLVDGINHKMQEFKVRFNNRTNDDADDIIAFFDNKKGVTAFDYTYPDSNAGGSETTIKVVCEEYNLTFVNDDHSSVDATFRRVYES